MSGDTPTLPRIAYSVTEASAATGMTEKEIREHVKAGRLPAARRSGRRILITDRALREFLAACETTGQDEAAASPEWRVNTDQVNATDEQFALSNPPQGDAA